MSHVSVSFHPKPHVTHNDSFAKSWPFQRPYLISKDIYVHICIYMYMYSLIASGQDWVPIRKPSSRKPTTTFDSQEETARDAEDPGSVPGPAVDGSGSMAVDTPADKAVGREPCAYKHL